MVRKLIWGAFTRFYKRPLSVLLSVVIDVVFLVLFGVAYGYLFLMTATHIDALNNIIAGQTAQVMATSNPSTLSFTPEAAAHFHAILLGLFGILLSLYVLWSVSQGLNWWLAHRQEGENSSVWRVLMHMFRINLLWLACFVIVLFGTAWLAQQSVLSPLPILGPGAYEWIAFILLIVLAYVACVSYAYTTHDTPLRASLRASTHKWKKFVPVVLVALLVMGLLGWLAASVGQSNYYLGLVVIVLLLAWLAYARVLLSMLARGAA